MLINITNNLHDHIFYGTYGIKDLFILIDYVKLKNKSFFHELTSFFC